MIPKRIFYVWGANEAKRRDVLACMQSWRQACPEYEIIEINEESRKYFDFKKEIEENDWFRTVFSRKMWAYVSDYIRLKVLYDNGGIYFDTDVSVLKNFDDLLGNKCFVGMECSKLDCRDNLTEPAILGAQKGNVFIKEVLKFYNRDSDVNIWNTHLFILPDVFKFVLDKMYGAQNYPLKKDQTIIEYKDITIYPERYFIPFRWMEVFSPQCIEEDTYTIHWWSLSWTKPEMLFFLNNKHTKEGLQKSKEMDLKISELLWIRKNLNKFNIWRYIRTKILSKITFGNVRKRLKGQYDEQKKIYRAIRKGDCNLFK